MPLESSAQRISGTYLHRTALCRALQLKWVHASCIQVVKRPEARSLILAMTPVVVAEGVRSGIFCGRDLLFGKQNLTGSHLQGLRLPAWMLGFVTLLTICWMAMRLPNISVAPMSQV